MTLVVAHEDGRDAERQYALDVVLGEFLGIPFRTERQERGPIRIRDANSPGRELVVADVLFRTPPATWLTRASLPVRPLRRHAGIPILYGDGLFETATDRARIGIDIFGSCFFLLTRYQERADPRRDLHGRFSAAHDLCVQEGLAERPLVNEYVELLWTELSRLWPHLARRSRSYRVAIEHDVDRPTGAIDRPWYSLVGTCVADLRVRKSPSLALRRLRARASRDPALDPHNTFDDLMTLSEQRGLQSTFYFLCGRTAGAIDGNYDIGAPPFRQLLRRIHARGHAIGLHASYGSGDDEAALRRELDRLRQVCSGEGIEQAEWGNRQHYLRWHNPATWRHLDAIGIDFDSSLGFADRVGFRAGVCYDFPAFDLDARRALAIRERPLVAMDVAMFGPMKRRAPQVVDTVAELAAVCRQFRGTFVLLWHNTTLITAEQRRCYEQVLEAVAA